MSEPKLNQPLQDALDWAELPEVDEEVGMRLQKHGPYMATGNALAIVAAAYRETIIENDNLRQQIAKQHHEPTIQS